MAAGIARVRPRRAAAHGRQKPHVARTSDPRSASAEMNVRPDGKGPSVGNQASGQGTLGSARVGSTPTSVVFKQAAGLVGPAARSPRCKAVGGTCPVKGIGTGAGPGRGSSEVEHQATNLAVTGSTPVHNAQVGFSPTRTGTPEKRLTTEPEEDGRSARSARDRTGASLGTADERGQRRGTP